MTAEEGSPNVTCESHHSQKAEKERDRGRKKAERNKLKGTGEGESATVSECVWVIEFVS